MKPASQDETQASDIKVELTFSTDTYDPAVPSDATVTCAVVNESKKPVEASVGYDGRANKLSGENDLRWSFRLGLFPCPYSKDELPKVWVQPGERRLLYTLPLKEILLQELGEQGGSWGWGWAAHSSPHASPVHGSARERLGWQLDIVPKAEFFATVEINGERISSPRVPLAVTPFKVEIVKLSGRYKKIVPTKDYLTFLVVFEIVEVVAGRFEGRETTFELGNGRGENLIGLLKAKRRTNPEEFVCLSQTLNTITFGRYMSGSPPTPRLLLTDMTVRERGNR